MSDDLMSDDGVTHIRLSPDAATDLGRRLYIGAYQPFYDEYHGWFASLIAFWIWYDAGGGESLRGIHHDNMIRSSLSGLKDTAGNRAAVIDVLRRRIVADNVLMQQLRASTLPFRAYEAIRYNHRNEPSIYELSDRQWYIGALEQIRSELQQAR